MVEQWNWSGLMAALKEHERRDCQPQFSDVHFLTLQTTRENQQKCLCLTSRGTGTGTQDFETYKTNLPS